MKLIEMKSCLALACSLSMASAWAVDNNDLKNTVILTGLITNTFAIHNRAHFKPCDTVWQFGYMDGQDREMNTKTVRVSNLRCDMDTTDLLPQGLHFSVLPVALASVWTTKQGPFAHRNEELAFVPVGRFAWHQGAVVLDASFGVGPALIAKTQFGYKRKSTLFQFSDEMGVGISDAKQRMRLGFTYRHISNIDIKLPNNGMNFTGLDFTYSFK